MIRPKNFIQLLCSSTFSKILSLTLVVFIGHLGFSSTPPNILVIIGDDMGVDAINGFEIGVRHPSTPNLDALRSSGITFTNTWATPLCSSTRASLLTGKYGLNNGVNTTPGNLSIEHKSLYKEIKEQSDGLYRNCVIGKWHLSNKNDYDHPYEHGVDEFMGLLGGGVEDYYMWDKYENGTVDTCTTYATKYFTDYAINWIDQQQQPWFMWMAHVSPHTPLHVPPEGTYSIKNTDTNKRKYKAMIESLDHEIGRLLNSISEDVLENTIIIFLGDNGTPGNLISDFPQDRGKQTIYQGGINVPLIISGKGVSRKNENENALINVSDFYTTLSQIVNSDAYPANVVNDSYSFKHLLDGSEGIDRSYNYMELGANENVPENMYTVRNEQYKLLDLGKGIFEFYDLKADTFELNNLLPGPLNSQEDAAVNEMLDLMTEIRGEEVSIPTDNEILGKVRKYPIVHTGVSSFYNTDSEINTPDSSEDLYWQDAGRIRNTPAYTDNGDNTITDNVTSLMWQKEMGEKLSWFEAVEKANNLSLGGYDDWRIPSIKELYSLIDFSGQVMGAKAIDLFIDTVYFDQPLGDVAAGEREIDAQTWSSTHYKGLTMNGDTTIFGVNFIDGRIKGYPKYKPQNGETNKMYFRMVRGNVDYGNNLFIDHSDGTVSDSATMLMWQKADDEIARDWLTSIQYCEELELGGYDDWHLPNAKELQSIVDYKRSPSYSNSAAIDPVFEISEVNDPNGNPGHYPYYWATTSHLDGINPYNTGVYVAFGEALGKMNGNLLDVHGAGAQRSDPKTGLESDYPKYHGPQGDLQMVFNHCRCVREIEDNSTKIQEINSAEINVFPNPTRDQITIQWSGIEEIISNIKIYDLNGQLHFNGSISGNQIDVSHLADGFYFLSLQSEAGRLQVKKFVKMK